VREPPLPRPGSRRESCGDPTDFYENTQVLVHLGLACCPTKFPRRGCALPAAAAEGHPAALPTDSSAKRSPPVAPGPRWRICSEGVDTPAFCPVRSVKRRKGGAREQSLRNRTDHRTSPRTEARRPCHSW